ncbi:MAG: GIY-YIG nuclease family protein [Dehalococcoidia bacterium]|nr:GIY-YIG nuclease family protein [Dehalococcoidia bacterium]
MNIYYVYIMTNRSFTPYVGVTNNLERRVLEHRSRRPGSFTGRYHLDRLVYFEETDDVTVAIQREKQIKGWTRAKKMALVNSVNSGWKDLAGEWFDDQPVDSSHGLQPAQNDRRGSL